MTRRDDDFEELRPLGEASRTPDQQLDDHSTAEWLVRVDRADGTILFSQHDLKSRAAAVDLAQSIMELCTMLHREVVTERSQARKPMYVGSRPTGAANASNRMRGRSPDTARRPSDSRPRQPPTRPRGLDHQQGEFR